MEQIPGQMSMFDVHDNLMVQGFEYRFERYVGQRVKVREPKGNFVHGNIQGIGKFYTFVKGDDGRDHIGAPSSLFLEEEEKNGN